MHDAPDWLHPPGPLRIGISACLLGQVVRWDATHNRDAYLVERLGPHADFVPVCPEVAIGLGVPRPPIRLVRADGAGPTRAVGVDDPALDVSDALRAYGRRMAAELPDLDGYVLKRGSPSCGLLHVKRYRPAGRVPALRGVGLFAEALTMARPELPVEEEGRLGDPALRDAFLARLFAFQRWRALLAGGVTRARLADFQRRHRLVLRAHAPLAAPDLERRAAEAAARPSRAMLADYGRAFMSALGRPATRARHAAVLRHVLGLLRPALGRADRTELAARIEAYRCGDVLLAAPLRLLRVQLRRHPHPLASGQTYLEPGPAEFLLRFGAPDNARH